jgi:hypothetical protein
VSTDDTAFPADARPRGVPFLLVVSGCGWGFIVSDFWRRDEALAQLVPGSMPDDSM